MLEVSPELPAAISRHPWTAVTIAFIAGAMIAVGERSKSALIRATSGALGSATVAMVRQHVLRDFSESVQAMRDLRQS